MLSVLTYTMQAIFATLHFGGVHLLSGAAIQHVPFEGNLAQQSKQEVLPPAAD